MIEEESVSGITSTNANLEVQVSPHWGDGAQVQFQLVTDPEEFASEILCPYPPEPGPLCLGEDYEGKYGEGAFPILYFWKEAMQVSLNLSEDFGVTLQPGTTYHYRVLAARAIFSEDTIEWEEPTVFGPDQTFTTPEEELPTIDKESVSGITPTNAILEAQISPHSENGSDYQFQLVTDPEEYASEILCPEPPFGHALCLGAPAAEGVLPIRYVFEEATPVSLDLSSEGGVTLQPGTTYHYRVLAARSALTEDTIEWEPPIVYGADQTFTTPEEEPAGPTNRRTLSIAKAANGPGGLGSVSSKPKGIRCGINCSSAVASLYENSTVELIAKPGTHSAFSEWKGGDCEGSHSLTCTVTMDTAESIEAVFIALPLQSERTITPAEALTLSKGESTGKGTVKGSGIACEAECTQTVVLYQGPVGLKPGKKVLLSETAAPGSAFVGWSGPGAGTCTTASTCEVEMSGAKEVTATFALLPAKTLSITKSANGPGGLGTVSSKPKGIKCANTCESAEATFWEGASVELTAKPGLHSSFVKWHNPGGSCNESTSLTCTVAMASDEAVEAVFAALPLQSEKTIAPAEVLTLSKEGSGLGTVKGSGLTCEVLCGQTVVLYQGPVGIKLGKTVTLVATSAPGSKKVVWSGCESEPEPEPGDVECVVTMNGAQNVTATFDELE